MRHHNHGLLRILAVLLSLSAVAAIEASAQTTRRPTTQSVQSASATQADIDRLQNSVNEAERAVARLRDRDANLASRLQDRLDDARDEVTYLRVKLRKEGRVSSGEVADARDQIEQVRAQAVGDIPDAYSQPRGTVGTRSNRDDAAYPRETVQQGRSARANEIPVGTEMDVRLQTVLSSDTAQVEDPFEATTLVDLMSGDKVLVPAGSTVRGIVSAVDKAGRIERKGRLTLRFDRMSVDRTSYPIKASVTEALESGGYRGDAVKIGAGAGVGAIIGGILGGAKGALAGILIGGGGVVAATEGQDVNLPSGTVLRIRFDEPLVVR